MSIELNYLLVARVLFTVTTLGYSLVTVIVDFNATHASNPRWTPHARFHLVWQISSYAGFGLFALALIWWPGPLAVERLYLVAAIAAIIYAGFFVALLNMPRYGGSTYDDNGYAPFPAPLPVFGKQWDLNVTAFSIHVTILAAATLVTIVGQI